MFLKCYCHSYIIPFERTPDCPGFSSDSLKRVRPAEADRGKDRHYKRQDPTPAHFRSGQVTFAGRIFQSDNPKRQPWVQRDPLQRREPQSYIYTVRKPLPCHRLPPLPSSHLTILLFCRFINYGKPIIFMSPYPHPFVPCPKEEFSTFSKGQRYETDSGKTWQRPSANRY